MDELSPFGKPCTICSIDDDDEICMQGYIGIIPITLCHNCYYSIVQMVKILESIGDKEE